MPIKKAFFILILVVFYPVFAHAVSKTYVIQNVTKAKVCVGGDDLGSKSFSYGGHIYINGVKAENLCQLWLNPGDSFRLKLTSGGGSLSSPGMSDINSCLYLRTDFGNKNQPTSYSKLCFGAAQDGYWISASNCVQLDQDSSAFARLKDPKTNTQVAFSLALTEKVNPFHTDASLSCINEIGINSAD